MAGAARRGHGAGHTCLSHWTSYRRKGIAPGFGKKRCRGACAGASCDICHGVFSTYGEFCEGAERYLAGVSARARSGRGCDRFSRAQVGAGEDLPIQDLSRGDLFAVSGKVCVALRSEEHTSELQSPDHLVCRLLLEKKKKH